YFEESLALARAIGHQRLISVTLSRWGELHLMCGQWDLAAVAFGEALDMAREAGSQDLIATALYGMARASLEHGDHDAARRHGQESMEIFEAIGHNHAENVKQWLIGKCPDLR